MTQNETALSTIRSQLKAAAVVRDDLVTLFHSLCDMEEKFRQLDRESPGVSAALDFLSPAIDTLVEISEDMNVAEEQIHKQLAKLMRSR